jgi:hypothetical protein
MGPNWLLIHIMNKMGAVKALCLNGKTTTKVFSLTQGVTEKALAA